MRLTAMILVALAGQLTAQTPLAPMQPSGPWSMEYAENACVLSRNYGQGTDQVTIAFRPYALSNGVDFLVTSSEETSKSRTNNNATIILSASEKPIKREYSSYFQQAIGKRIFTTYFTDTELDLISDGNSLSISLANKPMMTFAVRGLKSARVALNACRADLLKSWSIIVPPDGSRAVAATLVTNSDFLNSSDYPIGALLEGKEGTSTLMWRIGIDGKAHDCRVTVSSGSDELDRTACAAILQRLRYKPALDKDNKPVESYHTQRIRWIK